MRSSQRCSVSWNCFASHTSSVFSSLRNDHHFTDITLASEDGQRIEAHRIILAASSPVLAAMLTADPGVTSTGKSPSVVFLRGVSSSLLCSLLDFIYLGSVIVSTDRIQDFIAMASELKIHGLSEADKKPNIKKEELELEERADSEYFEEDVKFQKTAPQHLGTKFECLSCDSLFASKQSLYNHKSKKHRNASQSTKKRRCVFAKSPTVSTRGNKNKTSVEENVENPCKIAEDPRKQ